MCLQSGSLRAEGVTLLPGPPWDTGLQGIFCYPNFRWCSYETVLVRNAGQNTAETGLHRHADQERTALDACLKKIKTYFLKSGPNRLLLSVFQSASPLPPPVLFGGRGNCPHVTESSGRCIRGAVRTAPRD